MQDQSKVMFVHIPKTAGTSIRNCLLSHKNFYNVPQVESYRGHTPIFLLEGIIDIDQYYKISVVRNPYRRSFSLYKSFLININRNLVLPSMRSLRVSYKEFLNYIRLYGSKHSQVIFNNASNAFFDQSFYVFDSNGKLAVDKIYRFENIKELESDFSISLPRMNASLYSEQEYIESNSIDTIELIKYIYHRDFSLFNYSMKFEDSI